MAIGKFYWKILKIFGNYNQGDQTPYGMDKRSEEDVEKQKVVNTTKEKKCD